QATLIRDVKPPMAGTASCAGRACHGGLEASDRADCCRLDEFTLWVTQDPHAGAYQTLLSSRSEQMAARLGIAAAHESRQCLPCHTTSDALAPASSPDAPAIVALEPRSGVGCEACHGNAIGWLD